MKDSARELFVRSAEALNQRRAAGALLGMEEFLDAAHWSAVCRTVTEYHVEFTTQVTRALTFLIGHPAAERPKILGFLAASSLEGSFERVEPRSAGLAQITNYLEYLTAKTLVRLFAAPDAGTSYIQLCAAEMFGALWSIAGASEGSFGRRWQAQERALALELGRGEEVYQAYAPGKCFEVTEGEDSNGTVIRACWLLAGLASDRLAPPNRLAADACFTLLQFNNYRWALNGDASARIDLVRLVLIGQMLGRIVNGRAPADVDFFGSVAPSRVFAEMERIENA